MRLGLRVSLASAGVLAVAVAGATPAIADDATTIAQGVVTTDSGAPAAGVPVALIAWPANSQLASMAVGDQFTQAVIGSTTTATDGSYSVQIPSDTNLSHDADTSATSRLNSSRDRRRKAVLTTSVTLSQRLRVPFAQTPCEGNSQSRKSTCARQRLRKKVLRRS